MKLYEDYIRAMMGLYRGSNFQILPRGLGSNTTPRTLACQGPSRNTGGRLISGTRKPNFLGIPKGRTCKNPDFCWVDRSLRFSKVKLHVGILCHSRWLDLIRVETSTREHLQVTSGTCSSKGRQATQAAGHNFYASLQPHVLYRERTREAETHDERAHLSHCAKAA